MKEMEFDGISKAYSEIEQKLTEERTRFERVRREWKMHSNTFTARKANYELYKEMRDKKLISEEEFNTYLQSYDKENRLFIQDFKERTELMFETKAKVSGLQSAIDGYLEQTKSDPEVAKVVDDLLEKGYEEKRKEYEAKKDRATGKRVIIEEIKSNQDARQNLEEILKLGKKITELNAIVNAEGVDENSPKYQAAKDELDKIVPDINTKKVEFAVIVGGFDKEKKKMTEEVLEDLLKGETKVDKDEKILVTDMLDERITIEGKNIENAEKGIKFNENCIQEITGKAPQQAENQGQENLEQEEQEQPEESKKPGFFKRAKNFFGHLFAKEDPKKALPDPEQQEQVAKEGQQEAPEKKKEESSFIKYLRSNQDDAVLKAVMEKKREEIEQAVKRAQEQKGNDDHGGPEL